jgi:hypothetical protein
MKIRFPEIAIIDKDPKADFEIIRVLDENLPCITDTYSCFASFMDGNAEMQRCGRGNLPVSKAPKEYQLIVVDPFVLEDRIANLLGISDANPASKILVATGMDICQEELVKLSNLKNRRGKRIIDGFVLKPKGEGDYRGLGRALEENLAAWKSTGAFRMNFPLAIWGCGRLSTETVNYAVRAGFEVYWFSETLRGKKMDGIGYDEWEKGNNIPPSAKTHHCNSLDEITGSDAGFFILTNSDHESMPSFRSREEIDPWLAKNSRRTLGIYLEFIKSAADSDGAILIASNPPEVNAQRAYMCHDIDRRRIVTCSNDAGRGESSLARHTKLDVGRFRLQYTLSGHTTSIFVPEAVLIDGGYIDFGQFGSDTLATARMNAFRSVVGMDIRQHGPVVIGVMKALDKEKRRKRFPLQHRDTAEAIVRELGVLRDFGRPRFGYYQRNYDMFFNGPPPRVNYKTLRFYEPGLTTAEKRVYRSHDLQLKEDAKRMRDLADPVSR